jgi:TonB-like protein
VGRERRRVTGVSAIAVAVAILAVSARGGAKPLVTPPSLRETGRVADIPLAHATWRVERAAERAPSRPPRDPVVRPHAGQGERRDAGTLSATIIAHELEKSVAALQNCRIEVARRERRTWSAIAAGRVTLRWTILPAGTVASVDVKPSDPLDLHVLDCVKRTMMRWTFARPEGGGVAVSIPFAFR